jgi:hypothetical protein
MTNLKSFLLASPFLLFLSSCSTDEDNVNGIVNTDPNCSRIIVFADANFKAKLLEENPNYTMTLEGYSKVDTNGDGEIQVCEAENVGMIKFDNAGITNFEGLLEFRNLQSLSIEDNSINGPLNLSSLKRLVNVNVGGNGITELNVQGLQSLKILQCRFNNLQELNIKSLPSLSSLYCQSNQISTLNFTGSNNLKVLHVYSNQISELNVTPLSDLQQLYTQYNELSSLNLNGLVNLNTVNCSNNNLQTLTAVGCSVLLDMDCNQNDLTQLNLQGCVKLITLNCYLNNLPTLNLSGLVELNYCALSGNSFTTMDLRDCVNMSYLDVSFNPQLQTLIVKNGSVASQGVNIYQCPSLSTICCDVTEQAEMINEVQTYGYACNVITNCF